jgi:hypothetical protein
MSSDPQSEMQLIAQQAWAKFKKKKVKFIVEEENLIISLLVCCETTALYYMYLYLHFALLWLITAEIPSPRLKRNRFYL